MRNLKANIPLGFSTQENFSRKFLGKIADAVCIIYESATPGQLEVVFVNVKRTYTREVRNLDGNHIILFPFIWRVNKSKIVLSPIKIDGRADVRNPSPSGWIDAYRNNLCPIRALQYPASLYRVIQSPTGLDGLRGIRGSRN